MHEKVNSFIQTLSENTRLGKYQWHLRSPDIHCWHNGFKIELKGERTRKCKYLYLTPPNEQSFLLVNSEGSKGDTGNIRSMLLRNYSEEILDRRILLLNKLYEDALAVAMRTEESIVLWMNEIIKDN